MQRPSIISYLFTTILRRNRIFGLDLILVPNSDNTIFHSFANMLLALQCFLQTASISYLLTKIVSSSLFLSLSAFSLTHSPYSRFSRFTLYFLLFIKENVSVCGVDKQSVPVKLCPGRFALWSPC